jgi:hypothetical protein
LSQAFRFIGTLKIEGMSYQCISTFYNYDGRGVTYLVFYNDIDEKRYQIDYSEELPIAVEMDCLVFSSYKICNFSFNVDLCFPNGTCYLPE